MCHFANPPFFGFFFRLLLNLVTINNHVQINAECNIMTKYSFLPPILTYLSIVLPREEDN